MTKRANGNGFAGESFDRLVVVGVKDAVEPQLIGQTGGCYQSPPQTREQAVALVRLLIGRAPHPDGEREWTVPIAGGRRVVSLTEARER